MHKKHFFFDYPLIDAHAIACSALRLICHGSIHGVFGSYGSTTTKDQALDLEKIDAFKISLARLSNDALTDQFEYSLVYVTKELSEHLWDGEKRALAPDVKSITRRVHLNETASIEAKRDKTPFWVRSLRPIYLAKYDIENLSDHYIPDAYNHQFHEKYQGFLMRSEVNYPVVRNIFEAYDLEMTNRRKVKDVLDGDLEILSYTTKSPKG